MDSSGDNALVSVDVILRRDRKKMTQSDDVMSAASVNGCLTNTRSQTYDEKHRKN